MSETVTQVSETVQQIVRSRTCGCRDFYIAKITQNDATYPVASFCVISTSQKSHRTMRRDMLQELR